jgi:hypothetical protein
MSATSLEELVREYGLKPHPEGGFYAETYRSPETVRQEALPGRFPGDRAFSTSILYLLPEGVKSKWHRIKSDELWHFHLGGPLVVEEVSPAGKLERTVLGPGKNERLQHAVAAGRWFRSCCVAGSGFSLVGCTVAPGFDFADFETIGPEELALAHPSLPPKAIA